jgi:16S rRNA (uracil1498-N3)-methyltransferase
MTPPLFFVDPDRLALDEIRLDGAEGRHAARVRRIHVGERVDVADGFGSVAECVVVAVGRDALDLRVSSRRTAPPPQPRLTVVQAVPKGERAELAVSAMTEVGVDAIVAWSAARCVVSWDGERAGKGVARWRTAAREAAKQARRTWLPEVYAADDTHAVAGLLVGAALGVVLHEEAARPLSALTAVPDSGDVVVVVGPEGGLTREELAAFAAVGADAYRLGPTVLRSSTAGVVASALLLARSGRWS